MWIIFFYVCFSLLYLVGETGLEPARVLPHNDLNVARIPIPPPAHDIWIILYISGAGDRTRTCKSLGHSVLNTACIPIPPLRLIIFIIQKTLKNGPIENNCSGLISTTLVFCYSYSFCLSQVLFFWLDVFQDTVFENPFLLYNQDDLHLDSYSKFWTSLPFY